MIQKTKIERSKPCHEKIGKDFPLLVLGTDDVPFPDGSRICELLFTRVLYNRVRLVYGQWRINAHEALSDDHSLQKVQL